MEISDLINQEIQNLVEEKIIPGATWAFVSPDKNQTRTFGKLGFNSPFDVQSLQLFYQYDVASLTKILGTTTRILQLIDKKVIDFNTPVHEILKDYPHLSMTIQELLLHQSGLPADLSDKENITDNYFESFFNSYIPPKNEKKVCYSDLGYILLGWIIEKIDQSSLEDSFSVSIFEPLQMNQTHFYVEQKDWTVPSGVKDKRGIVQGSVNDSKAFYSQKEIGSAGLFSTIHDLILFVQAYLNRDERLFSWELFEKMTDIDEENRTLGWEWRKIRKNGVQNKYLYHTGHTGPSIGIDMEKRKGFIFLTNRWFQNSEVHAKKFLIDRENLYQQYFEGV